MKTLKLNRLLILSPIKKSARQLKFNERFNLITSKRNNQGKSSLIKSILWAFGCEPTFSKDWPHLGVEVMIEFSLGDKIYKVIRKNKSKIYFISENECRVFEKISGDYSFIFNSLVNFQVLLTTKDKEDPHQESTPPPYYFIPFYIDQEHGWTKAWQSFGSLQQYESWINPVIKYHTGYTSIAYIKKEQEIFEKKKEIKRKEKEVEIIDSSLAFFEEYVPSPNIALCEEDFESIKNELIKKLDYLYNHQKNLLNEYYEVKNEKHRLNSQLEIALRAIAELESDYAFSVERIEGDELECPLCGTIHDNSLLSRASILSDKRNVEDIALLIEEDLKKIDLLMNDISEKKSIIKEQINEVKNNFLFKKLNIEQTINGFASQSVQKNINIIKKQKYYEIQEKTYSKNILEKELKNLMPKNHKKELDAFFKNTLHESMVDLNVKDNDISNIKSPLDYAKVRSGGSAHKIRDLLAYQITILKQIYTHSQEIPSMFIADTLNQQEQDMDNYERIMNFIQNKIPDDVQVIIGAMPHVSLNDYKEASNVIELDERLILLESEYEAVRDEIEHLQSICHESNA